MKTLKQNIMLLSALVLSASVFTGCETAKPKTKEASEIQEVTEEVTEATVRPAIVVENKKEQSSVTDNEQPVTDVAEPSGKEEPKQETEAVTEGKVIHKQSAVEIDNSQKNIHFGVDKNTDFDLSVINICGANIDLTTLDYDTLISNAHLQKNDVTAKYDFEIKEKEMEFRSVAYCHNFSTEEGEQVEDIVGNTVAYDGTGNIINLVVEDDKTINTFIANKIWSLFPNNLKADEDVPLKFFGKIDWQKPVSLKKIKKILGEGTERNSYVCYNDGTTTVLIEPKSEGSDFVRRIYFYDNSTINVK